ncbi:histone H1 [Maudiozyma humilis]|uniref:Histone H1 n=1 Tax=Maudiozyma humilis TaxID=51915 RepID=A0AAV5RZV9_MAUHU|nr:histone H1 [Kazachstania humilis]
MAPKKATKTTSKKVAKSSSASGAPSKSYKELITEAAQALKSRKGVSRPALKKYIKDNHPSVGASASFDHYFNAAIKKGVDAGDFEQPKGPSGALKVVKKAASPAPAAKKVAKKAAAAPKKVAKKTAAAPKKVAKKAAAPKKAAASSSAAPTYKEMIIKSILSINNGKGSSRLAVKKHMKGEYAKKISSTKNFDHLFNSTIKKAVESGDLAQPKGPSGIIKVLKKGKTAVGA